jgi:N-acetylneuraminic acid mutarotase
LKTLKRRSALLTLVLVGGLLFAESEIKFDPLPVPLSNSAITSVRVSGHVLVFSFMGMGAKNTWDAVTNSSYALNTSYGKWTEIRQGPGAVGRVGAAAAGVREQAYLLGGFVVNEQGAEAAISDAELYDPLNRKWYRIPDLPVPVADAVVGVYRDRYIYLIGGWSTAGAARAVQIYDVEKQGWLKGTDMTGEPVFGHAGAIVGDTIVYVDGARNNSAAAQPRFVTSQDCWMGKIDHKNPAHIEWSKLSDHPGAARFHIAAGGSDKDEKVYFSGGSENLYDYKGVGLDGKPAEPSALTFAFNLRTSKWESINENTPDPALDNRQVLVMSDKLLVIGGMEKGRVTARVNEMAKTAKAK